jgi:hypothetical protein
MHFTLRHDGTILAYSPPAGRLGGSEPRRDRLFNMCPAEPERESTVLRTSIIGLALMVALLAGMPGSAGAITIISGDGTESCATNAAFASESCAQGAAGVDKITRHDAWQTQPADGALWISYKNTGIGAGATLAPTTAHTVPNPVPYLMLITESFVTDIDGALLDLTTWADDTAELWIDGVKVMDANFTQGTCAVGVIGCQPGEGFFLEDHPLGAAGQHTIEWYVFQVGVGTNPQDNPFGLLYSGSTYEGGTPDPTCEACTPVPEPATLFLVGTGMAAAGAVAWRRRRAATAA